MGKKARAAGSFLGGITNNPGVVILGLALGALLIFKGDITKAFGSLGSGLGNIEVNLPDVKFPDIKFPDITFPDFKFPDFKFPDITNIFGNGTGESDLAGKTVPFGDSQVMIPADTTVNPDGTVTSSTPPIVINGGATQEEFDFAKFRAESFDTLFDIIGDPKKAQELISGAGQDKSAIEKILFQAGQGFFNDQPVEQPSVTVQPVETNLPTGFDFFNPSGEGFTGAAINPTPIGNLSLSQIIDQFNVTASQAANIKAIANDDFGNFDFGTNTGSGIGSILPSISSLIPSSDLNVSSNQFEGLSAEQIAAFLTGGNIQNF